ncbi:hypothetical protein KXR53_21075 [Inquilinus limosus]|uniref:hypothetical protein n=1 Tax=Inquilinus limosus TaxID=171674 RepID=UPI003F190792
MTKYRNFPWKRNIRRVPTPLSAKLQQIPRGAGIVAVCTKRITADELNDGAYRHLKMKLVDGEPTFPPTVLPREDAGPYSYKNRNGWEVKRHDLPMILKTIYLGERPVYGDWTNGSFPLWQERQVYQVDEYASTDYSIAIDLLTTKDGNFIFKFNLDCVLDIRDSDFEEDLLFCLNILQENTGVCDIDRSDKTRQEYVETTLVDWEIFPPGSIDRFLAKAKAELGKANGQTNQVIDERVAEFRRLSPERYILGKGGFNRYIGAVLPHDVVVFENVRYGNALYVLHENWEEVSQRSRTNLLKGTSADYDRIPHVEGWQEQFREAVRRRSAHRRR